MKITNDSTCRVTNGSHNWVSGLAAQLRLHCAYCNVILGSDDQDPLWRPTWPAVWMSVARVISERSVDPALKVGAIIVSCDNTRVLSVGYNGMWKGGPNVVESLERGKSGTIHAETNAIVKCDFNFPKAKHMYVTHSPCRECAKLIINAEVSRVVFDVPYRDASGVDLLRSSGVEVFSLEDLCQ